MNASPEMVLLSVAIGAPLMVLALGVLYHAYVLNQQPQFDALDAHVEALATESTDALLVSLQEAVIQMQGQLAHQRASLANLLSDAGRTTPPSGLSDRPMAAGEFVAARVMPATAGRTDLRPEILHLAAEGLSDRAIARELHIGLEEVRIARLRGTRS